MAFARLSHGFDLLRFSCLSLTYAVDPEHRLGRTLLQMGLRKIAKVPGPGDSKARSTLLALWLLGQMMVGRGQLWLAAASAGGGGDNSEKANFRLLSLSCCFFVLLLLLRPRPSPFELLSPVWPERLNLEWFTLPTEDFEHLKGCSSAPSILSARSDTLKSRKARNLSKQIAGSSVGLTHRRSRLLTYQEILGISRRPWHCYS